MERLNARMRVPQMPMRRSPKPLKHAAAAALLAAWGAFVFWPAAVLAADAGPVQVLQSAGELGRKGTPGALANAEAPAGTVLQAGAVPASTSPEALVAKPPAATAALSFAPGEVVTLSTGASAGRSGTLERGEYQLSGAAHVLLDLGEPPGHEVVINGAVLRIAKAHLFFNGWVSPSRLYVVEGNAKLVAANQEAGAETEVVGGEWIVLDGKTPKAEGSPGAAVSDPLLAWSQLAGFEAPGPYKYVGDAFPADGKLRVNRNNKLSQLSGDKIAIFESDQLVTDDGQRVRIQFKTGDKIALTGKTVFRVDEYLPDRQQKPSVLFSVLGRVRSLIASRLAPDSVRMKTPTATIGVKGTDFNTIAGEESTLVETVDGTVGVGDVAGNGEVALGPGTQSTVPAGGSPSAPSAISPQRLQELQAEAAAAGLIAAAAVPAPPPPAPPVAAAPPPPPPPPAAEAAPAPAPAPARPSAPAGNICERLGRAYQDSIAAKTGATQDELYLAQRGEFGCADIPKTGGTD